MEAKKLERSSYLNFDFAKLANDGENIQKIVLLYHRAGKGPLASFRQLPPPHREVSGPVRGSVYEACYVVVSDRLPCRPGQGA